MRHLTIKIKIEVNLFGVENILINPLTVKYYKGAIIFDKDGIQTYDSSMKTGELAHDIERLRGASLWTGKNYDYNPSTSIDKMEFLRV